MNPFSRLASISGLRSDWNAETLIGRRWRNVIHIWPSGGEFASDLAVTLEDEQETLCGARIDGSHAGGWRRCGRGAFQTPPNDRFRVCSRCAKHAAEYPEASERRDQVHLACGLYPDRLDAALEQAREFVLTELTVMLNTSKPTVERASESADELVHAALMQATIDALQARGALALERSIDAGSGHRSLLQRELGLSWEQARDFKTMASWLSRADWAELVRDAIPLMPTRPVLSDHDRWRREIGAKVIKAGQARGPRPADQS